MWYLWLMRFNSQWDWISNIWRVLKYSTDSKMYEETWKVIPKPKFGLMIFIPFFNFVPWFFLLLVIPKDGRRKTELCFSSSASYSPCIGLGCHFLETFPNFRKPLSTAFFRHDFHLPYLVQNNFRSWVIDFRCFSLKYSVIRKVIVTKYNFEPVI